ncbi:alpha/beta hydrolase [Cohnella nanjingensis]|uniref:Lysophospholipase n=1 Tax=Cohnella nanjingensis TaxID=1387779 RepID=A0A7X0RMF5_9BACL|nr:alpha/beta hydrolase [Cohnella nanjingensis]MBB6670227.1 lysophospholipase [Cohnella nanjingensis]
MEAAEGMFQGHQGIELFYRKIPASGAPARGAVIAVHGLGDHSGGLQNLWGMLTEGGYHVYAFDLRGHGRSSGSRGFIRDWEEYRGDLHAFRTMVASEIAELPLYLAGHSLGGVVCADYALYHGRELSGLMLIAPALSYEATFWEKCLIACMAQIKPDLTVRKQGSADALTCIPEIRARLVSDPWRHNAVTPGLGLGLMRAIKRIRSQAHAIQVPLLLQYGLDDAITPPAQLQAFFDTVGIANRQKFEYEAVRHRPFEDEGRETFGADLLGWLNRH